MRFFVAFVFFVQSGESIYDSSRYDSHLFYDIDSTLSTHNQSEQTEQTTFHRF